MLINDLNFMKSLKHAMYQDTWADEHETEMATPISTRKYNFFSYNHNQVERLLFFIRRISRARLMLQDRKNM